MQMSINDVAEYFKISRRTVYRWLEKGAIPAYKINDQYRFDYSELVEWSTANKLGVVTESQPSEIKTNKPKYPLYAAVQSGGIYYRIEGRTINTAYRNILDLIKIPSEVDKLNLLRSLLERENIASTGIGNGIAVPKFTNYNDFRFSCSQLNICFLDEQVDFYALDGIPVRCVFLLFSTDLESYINIMSRVNFLLRNNDFIVELESHPSREHILKLFKSFESDFKTKPNPSDKIIDIKATDNK